MQWKFPPRRRRSLLKNLRKIEDLPIKFCREAAFGGQPEGRQAKLRIRFVIDCRLQWPAMRGPKALAAIAALLFSMGDGQAQSCAGLYKAIKLESKYCGFFCDQARLKPLQEAYSASCIHVVLPIAPFDLDSIPQDGALVAEISGIGAAATSPASTR